jgi:hypothetical protein
VGHARHRPKNNDIVRKAYPKGIVIYDAKKGLFDPQSLLYAQPRRILAGLRKIPDTGLLADYMTVEHMCAHIEAAKSVASQVQRDVYVSIGFHFEGNGNFQKILKVAGARYGK